MHYLENKKGIYAEDDGDNVYDYEINNNIII
jgi:hypothetical protein